MHDLGAMIRTKRKERHMTQKELGKALGVSEAMISKYESNTAEPTFETLRNIASLFNVSLDELAGMQHAGFMSLHGLSASQSELLRNLADGLRRKNTMMPQTVSEEQYALLGMVAAELLK